MCSVKKVARLNGFLLLGVLCCCFWRVTVPCININGGSACTGAAEKACIKAGRIAVMGLVYMLCTLGFNSPKLEWRAQKAQMSCCWLQREQGLWCNYKIKCGLWPARAHLCTAELHTARPHLGPPHLQLLSCWPGTP